MISKICFIISTTAVFVCSVQGSDKNGPPDGPIDDETYKLAFDVYDKDESNLISKDELTKVVNLFKLGVSEDDIEEFMKKVDEDKSNEIDLPEFKNMPRTFTDVLLFKNLYSAMDKNGDGKTTLAEVRNHLETLELQCEKEGLDQAINSANVNENGEINHKEMLKLLKSIVSKGK